MDFEDFRGRIHAERKLRAQRDAAERVIPGERLRREIREAFARERAGPSGEDPEVGVKPDRLDSPDGSGDYARSFLRRLNSRSARTG